jgi:hypothetical protein
MWKTRKGGSIASNEQKEQKEPSTQSKVVETVGASFNG